MIDLSSAPLIILTGPPGAGKTTIAGELAQRYDRAVHLHTDDFWHHIASGGIAPFEPEADQASMRRCLSVITVGVVAGAALLVPSTASAATESSWATTHEKSPARSRVVDPASEITSTSFGRRSLSP